MSGLTILHTSDWHLGHQIYRKRRDDEFEAFLNWLAGAIAENHVDHVIIAGDVFDTTAPATSAQRLYYDFLLKAGAAGARSIIITAGNHDSAAFLTAPAEILRSLQVYVIGAVTDNPEDEILVLRSAAGEPEAIVCAVPFLRERDVRESEPGESIDEKERKLAAAIRGHYEQVASLAEAMRNGREIPLIGTGHLYTAGGISGDGVREIGFLGNLPHDIFSDAFDYVALGHLHRQQKVGDAETRRYCGSPLPMSFAEANQVKGCLLAHFDGRQARVENLPTPQFRQFRTLRGSRAAILVNLAELVKLEAGAERETWLEIQHDGSDAIGDLNQAAHELVKGAPLEILCVRAARPAGAAADLDPGRGLEEFTPLEMFEQRLAQQGYEGESKTAMLAAFKELLGLLPERQEE